MSSPLPRKAVYSTEQFLSGANLELTDQVVNEVVETMLGLTPETIGATHSLAPRDRSDGDLGDLWATVRFAGLMKGACELRMNAPAAGFIASLLLGMPIAEDDASIGDTVGELCNIIGGGWKNRILILSSRCSLSTPTILSGPGNLLGSPTAHLTRIYSLDGHILRVTLTQEDVE